MDAVANPVSLPPFVLRLHFAGSMARWGRMAAWLKLFVMSHDLTQSRARKPWTATEASDVDREVIAQRESVTQLDSVSSLCWFILERRNAQLNNSSSSVKDWSKLHVKGVQLLLSVQKLKILKWDLESGKGGEGRFGWNHCQPMPQYPYPACLLDFVILCVVTMDMALAAAIFSRRALQIKAQENSAFRCFAFLWRCTD